MARKRVHAAPENHERWLISYADFITLLFAFFVVMFASSQTDKGKAQQVSDSVKEAIEKGAGVKAAVHEILGGTVDDKGKGNRMMKGPGGAQIYLPKSAAIPTTSVPVTSLMPSMRQLTQSLAKEIREGKVEVHLESRGLVISLRQAAYFPSGGDEVNPETLGSLASIATTLQSVQNPLRLEDRSLWHFEGSIRYLRLRGYDARRVE
jgi:chemotaxis protein MotB